MLRRPAPVTDLRATGSLMRIELHWTPQDWSTPVDHHRVHALPTDQVTHRFLRHPGEDTLVARTIYPRFTHDRLNPAGRAWTYVVVTVDAAGQRSRPSAPARATSTRSVTTGRPVATLGSFDRKSLELRFAPAGYKKIPTAHPDGVITLGPQDGTAQLPYLLPGPGDRWAGSRAYSLRWTPAVESAPARPALALWGIDTTRLGGRLEAQIGDWSHAFDLPKGATKGSRTGDATVEDSPLHPVELELELPATALSAAAPTLELTLAEGGWVAWDAIGLFELG